ncbi:MAG TPA: transposase [Candidatus Binatia bacterium]
MDQFVIMPNHLHGIIHITDPVGAQHAAPAKSHVQPGSLGAIVRSFKAAVSKRCKKQDVISAETIWQRNYYDHIIRDEDELTRIREYIASNPLRWSLDPENPFAAQAEPKDSLPWTISGNSTVRAQHAAPLLRNLPKI